MDNYNCVWKTSKLSQFDLSVRLILGKKKINDAQNKRKISFIL